MRLFLFEWRLSNLGMGKNSDNSAIPADALKFVRGRFTRILSVLFGVFGEGLLFRLVPVLVKSSLDLITKMSRPDSSERPKAAWSFNVADKPNDNDLWLYVSSFPEQSWLWRNLPEEFQ